jgi:hypothetical protein
MHEIPLEGTRWVSDDGAFIVIRRVHGSSVYFSFVSELGKEYHTSLKVFQLFYRQLEPEEEGLMLLGDL